MVVILTPIVLMVVGIPGYGVFGYFKRRLYVIPDPHTALNKRWAGHCGPRLRSL